LKDRFGIVDPKEEREEVYIDPIHLKPKERITKRSKTTNEVPRIEEEDIHQETLTADEMKRNEEHDDDALILHRLYLKVEQENE
jgi:hypothetical protein